MKYEGVLGMAKAGVGCIRRRGGVTAVRNRVILECPRLVFRLEARY